MALLKKKAEDKKVETNEKEAAKNEDAEGVDIIPIPKNAKAKAVEDAEEKSGEVAKKALDNAKNTEKPPKEEVAPVVADPKDNAAKEEKKPDPKLKVTPKKVEKPEVITSNGDGETGEPTTASSEGSPSVEKPAEEEKKEDGKEDKAKEEKKSEDLKSTK